MVSTAPFFTILLPTHNRADVIGASIESILGQSEQSWELLVVGDGCTDLSEEVVLGYARDDRRIQWLPFAKGAGFGYDNRNTALERRRGDYVAFAAHDDLWFPDHLEQFRSYLLKHSLCKILYSRPLWVHPDGTLIPSLFNITDLSTLQLFMEHYNEIPATCFVYNAKILPNSNIWDTSLAAEADLALWRSIIKKSIEQGELATQIIGFIPTPTTFHTVANWRKTDEAINTKLYALYRSIHTEPQYARALSVPTGRRAQQWELLKNIQSEAWVEATRINIQAFLDSYARNSHAERQLLAKLDKVTKKRGYRLLERIRVYLRKFSF